MRTALGKPAGVGVASRLGAGVASRLSAEVKLLRVLVLSPPEAEPRRSLAIGVEVASRLGVGVGSRLSAHVEPLVPSPSELGRSLAIGVEVASRLGVGVGSRLWARLWAQVKPSVLSIELRRSLSASRSSTAFSSSPIFFAVSLLTGLRKWLSPGRTPRWPCTCRGEGLELGLG